jgi:leader peptidase (prepilin peptidase)/N-methyltransferase
MLEDLGLLAIPPRELPPYAAAFVLGIGFVFGALWGSFLNVVIARVPMRQSVVHPRSRCPHCGTQITARDNIPMLSWLLLRAKCRTCGAPISARYPFVELLGGVAGAAAVARYGLSLAGLETFVFILALIAISFIDLDFFIVPTSLVVVLVVNGLGFGVARWLVLGPEAAGGLSQNDVVDRVIGAVGAGVLLWGVIVVSTVAIRKLSPGRIPDGETAMGYGDPLILVGIGAHLGWQLMPLSLFIASVFGSVIGLAAKYSGKLKNRAPIELPGEDPWTPMDDAVPFGPFLALGGLVAAFFGDAIYARLLPLLGLGEGGVLVQAVTGGL